MTRRLVDGVCFAATDGGGGGGGGGGGRPAVVVSPPPPFDMSVCDNELRFLFGCFCW